MLQRQQDQPSSVPTLALCNSSAGVHFGIILGENIPVYLAVFQIKAPVGAWRSIKRLGTGQVTQALWKLPSSRGNRLAQFHAVPAGVLGLTSVDIPTWESSSIGTLTAVQQNRPRGELASSCL
mgnify:CR=1 FL=1